MNNDTGATTKVHHPKCALMAVTDPATAIAAPPPMVRGLAARYIAGLHTRADRTLVILNATRILSATEQGALRDLEATP